MKCLSSDESKQLTPGVAWVPPLESTMRVCPAVFRTSYKEKTPPHLEDIKQVIISNWVLVRTIRARKSLWFEKTLPRFGEDSGCISFIRAVGPVLVPDTNFCVRWIEHVIPVTGAVHPTVKD